MNRRQCFIYGLFNSKGICVYVGCTVNPAKRAYWHLLYHKGKFYGRALVFKIIRRTTTASGNRLEKQIGAAYKRKGQAMESEHFNGRSPEYTENIFFMDWLTWDWKLTDKELAAIHGRARSCVNAARNRLKQAGVSIP